MRPINFRIWDNEKKEYFIPVYEAYRGELYDLSISTNGRFLRRTLEKPAEDESMFEGRYELEQFIGIIDKNEIKIYEKDKIIITYIDGRTEEMTVAFNNNSARFCLYDEEGNAYGFNNTTEFEVIGTIHD